MKKLLSLLAMIGLVSCGSSNEQKLDKKNQEPVSFEWLVEKATLPTTQAIDGSVVPTLFSAVHVSTHPEPYSNSSGACTSTMVGSDSLLTAAHCVDAKNPQVVSQSREAQLTIQGDDLIYECEMHPTYTEDGWSCGLRNSWDVALCKLKSGKIPENAKIQFENLELDKAPRVGDQIMLGGYGCYLEKWENGGYSIKSDAPEDEKYRIGNNTISEVKTGEVGDGSFEQKEFAQFVSVSAIDDGITDVCQGDSGGPVFSGVQYVNAMTPLTPRRIVGVNSGNNLLIHRDLARSVYTDLSAPEIANWIRKWSKDNNAEICGVTSDAKNCLP